MTRREAVSEGVASAAFLAAALGLGLGLDAGAAWPPAIEVVGLVVLFAAATRVTFPVGIGHTVPTQLVFVPMLLLLPLGWVPLLVMAGWLLGRVPDYARGRAAPARALLVPADCWYAIGPVAVLALAADPATPSWGDLPWYGLAFAAQVAVDVGVVVLRDLAARGEAPPLTFDGPGWVYLVDLLLSPIGALAGVAARGEPAAVYAVGPLMVLLVVFARERRQRLATERAAAKAREELIAAAGHELQTPAAVLRGLAKTLGRPMPEERRALVDAQITRETLRLEVLVRRFADYARIKGGDGLVVRPRATPFDRIAREAMEAVAGGERVELSVAEAMPAVLADPDRLRAALAAVLHNALRYSPAAMPVRVTAAGAAGGVVVHVDDRGPGIPLSDRERVFAEGWRGAAAEGHDGAGLGLFLARALLEAQDGRIEVAEAPGGGARLVLTLRAAA